jgi:hypothetical protein
MGAKVFFGAATGALLALMLASPALACKGAETLLRDDFTDEDPAWNIEANNAATIGNGVLTLKSDAGHFQNLMYQGMNFPEADVCVTLIAPNGKPSPDTQGGIGIWTGKAWNYIYITTDGNAGVAGLQDGSWTNPVPMRKSDAIKTGNDAARPLRDHIHKRQAVRQVQGDAERRPHRQPLCRNGRRNLPVQESRDHAIARPRERPVALPRVLRYAFFRRYRRRTVDAGFCRARGETSRLRPA